MDTTLLMLIIIVSMILLFAASNSEGFIADIINNKKFDNIRDKLNQVKVKFVEPALANYNTSPSTNGLMSSRKPQYIEQSPLDQTSNSGPSNSVTLSVEPSQNMPMYNLKAYNDDLDYESSANFGSQTTEINQFIKSTNQCQTPSTQNEQISLPAISWSARNAEMHEKLKNSAPVAISGTSAFDFNEGNFTL